MSLPAPGATPQAPISGPPVSPQTPVTGPSAPPAGPPTPGGPNDTTTEPSQESVRAKFATTPGFAVPVPSFSYGVMPKANTASGSSQQSPSTPASSQVLKLNPPTSAAALQPPVPGQSSATGPSFSYNIASQANVGAASSQQPQPQSSTATAPGNSQGGKLTPTTAASLQPPAPGQSGHANQFVPGKFPQNMAAPLQPPYPVPRGHPSIAAGFSFSGSSQLPATAEASPKTSSSNSNTSAAVAPEAVTALPTSSSTQSIVLHAHTSSSSSMIPPVPPNMYPTSSMWVQTAPSFPAPPGMPGTPGTPGPPGMPSSAPLSSGNANTVRPAIMDSSVSLRPMLSPASFPPNSTAPTLVQNVQQQIYPPYPSLPAMTPPPQALWLHPPQMGGLQRPPFVPYPGPLPGPFPVQIRGVPLPSVPLPDSQPPGVSLIGPPGGTSPAIIGAGQTSSRPQSPPPGIDQNKQANDLTNKDGDTAKKEDADTWTAHKTETGAVYYYNALTGESTYEKPAGFKGEPDKVTTHSTPVSSEKLAGTDWVLVTTNDGKKYYYNTRNKVSSWQVPLEVAEMRKKQESESLKANAASVQNASALADKGYAPVSLSAPSVNTGGRDAIALRTSGGPVSSSALDLIKKKLQDAGAPAASSPLPSSSAPSMPDLNGPKSVEATTKGQQSENSKDKLKDANGDGNMSDSSSDSDDVDSGPTKEECIIQFKEMLKERGVAPFSKWEKELPKILFDPRFKAVPGYSARRALFEHYVRTRAEEERKEKRAAQKAAIEGFKQLLEEASEDIDHKIDYQTFKRKWGHDPRFETLDRKERELLLNERVLPLKKAAEEKLRAIRTAAVSSFKSMLREKEDINTTSRWSRVKDGLRNDPRYKSVKHEDREVLFNEYISELKAAEEEVERAAKIKREEQEKLKERERETRKRKEREEQEMERVRLKVRRKEAVASYQALLVETIKDPKASWTESKPKLDKDPQGRATNPDLDKADTEKLFREHVKVLYERCARDFRAVLSEVITAERAAQVTDDGKTVLTSWSEAKHLLKPDPRYSKMPRKERESLWRRYAEEMQRKQKLDSDLKEEKSNAEVRNRISSDSARSPPAMRRTHSRR
ncbi:pre-mRNA-processing protein 40C isoform X2 [Magnolia sinica]|uniref:pre-mRNA-processing protein 40C isoform X2 n=1 Tax=Magnolia sinica TaxID=86752 RepID=UPI00265AEF57|nr:pre-mRNA-processing protein 40C isoform X2 [Magnolia sinica]